MWWVHTIKITNTHTHSSHHVTAYPLNNHTSSHYIVHSTFTNHHSLFYTMMLPLRTNPLSFCCPLLILSFISFPSPSPPLYAKVAAQLLGSTKRQKNEGETEKEGESVIRHCLNCHRVDGCWKHRWLNDVESTIYSLPRIRSWRARTM
jgi:hypothetical protein